MQRLAPETVLWCSVGTRGGPMGPEGRWSFLRTVLCPPHKGVETCDLSPVQALTSSPYESPTCWWLSSQPTWWLGRRTQMGGAGQELIEPNTQDPPRHLCLPLQSSLPAPHSGSPSMGESLQATISSSLAHHLLLRSHLPEPCCRAGTCPGSTCMGARRMTQGS